MASKDKNIARPISDNIICDHTVETSLVEMRLVFDCKECEMEADLKNRTCMSGALKALNDNSNADVVILSDYAELRYTGPTMKMMKSMIGLANELDNLSMKNPARDHFGDLQGQSAKDKRAAACNACQSNPQNIFPGLKKACVLSSALCFPFPLKVMSLH